MAVVNSVQEYWPQQVQGYRQADTVFFSGQVSTGCGAASSAVGPFYCPADELVYIDLSFFDELQQRFGVRGGPFAQAYVIAHEYGHHVQHLLGTDERVGDDRTGPTSGSVRLELQADCFAGVWGHHTGRATGIRLEPGDVEEGLNAAAAIGDDRIQRRTQGRVSPESFTHGTSEQRVEWLKRGLQSGRVETCDTFASR